MTKAPGETPLPVKAAIAALFNSPFRLSVAALVAAVLAVILPFVGIRLNIGFGTTNGSLSGAEAAGIVALITVAVFALAVGSHKLPKLYPYKNLLELGAVASACCMLLWAWFANPAAQDLAQIAEVTEQFAPTGSTPPEPVGQYPHLGMFLLVAATSLVMLSRYQDRKLQRKV